MPKNQIKIIGLKELQKDLRTLPILKQASIIKSANRKAGNAIVVKRLIQAVPFKSHKVRKGTKKDPYGRRHKKQAITTSVKGSKTAVVSGISGAYFHYRFTERGTEKRTTKNYKHLGFKKNVFGKRRSIRVGKKQLNRGVMPKTKPFANRVLDASINPLFRYLKTEYVKSIEKSLKRAKLKR